MGIYDLIKRSPGTVGSFGVGILFAAAVLSSCAGFGGLLEEPEARIRSMEISRIDFESAEILVNVEVRNPNPIAVSLSAYDYGLEAWDSIVVEGRREEGASLRAEGISTIPIPVEISLTELVDLGTSAVQASSVPLEVRLGLEVALPYMGAVRLDLSSTIDLPIPRIPLLQPRSLRVESVGLAGAEISLVSEVKNPNGFALTINELGGNLTVAGGDWGAIGISESAVVDAGKSKNLEFRMRVNFAEVGLSAWNLLTGSGNADVELQGVMDIDLDIPAFDGSGIPWDADAKVSIVR